jgi:anti-sigma factor RsiW
VLIDDYLDGTLKEAQHQEVELHLASCASCRAEEQATRRLLQEAAALPKEMRPERDLWPEIAARASRSRRGGLAFLRSPALLAAAAALVVALGVVMTGVRERGPQPLAPAGTLQPAGTGAASVREAEAEYVKATGELMAAVNARRGQLSPETLQAVEKNLATIDQALNEVRAALEKDPGNAKLTKMLTSTHQRKLDLLLRLIRLSSQI